MGQRIHVLNGGRDPAWEGTNFGEKWCSQFNKIGERGISHAKTAELIELRFSKVSGVGQRNHVLDECAHWCHLANTVERLCAAAVSGSTTRGGN